jgi:integrase
MNKILSAKEIEGILIKVRPLPNSYYWSAVIAIMAYAGLSDEEVIELLSEDVDLKARLIKVRSSNDSAKGRTVQISEDLFIILEKCPSSRSEYLLPNIEANSKKWFAKSFDLELKKRLPKNVSANDLSDSFQK